jgi:hypothetical protein
MNELTMDKMVQRIDRLEKENRWLKHIGVLVLVGIAAVVLMGQAMSSRVAKVIQAEKFVLRDSSGRIRAELSTLHGGEPSLVLFDKSLITRAVLGVINGSPRLDIYDGNGMRRAVLGATLDGSPRLELYNPDGERRARLGLHANMANFALYDETGKTRFGLNVLAPGSPTMIFVGKNEMVQLSLDVLPDGRAGLMINDKGGASIRLSAEPDGLGLTIIDKDGTSRAVLGSTSLETIGTGALSARPESSLVLFDERGKVIWSAP